MCENHFTTPMMVQKVNFIRICDTNALHPAFFVFGVNQYKQELLMHDR